MFQLKMHSDAFRLFCLVAFLSACATTHFVLSTGTVHTDRWNVLDRGWIHVLPARLFLYLLGLSKVVLSAKVWASTSFHAVVAFHFSTGFGCALFLLIATKRVVAVIVCRKSVERSSNSPLKQYLRVIHHISQLLDN